VEKKRILAMSISTLISGLVLSIIALVPLGIKWELEKKIVILSAIFIGIISWASVESLSFFLNLKSYTIFIFQILVIAATSISLLLWRFFRNPERIPPQTENVILSPADGEIIYIKRINDGEIPLSEKSGKKYSLHELIQSNLLPTEGHLIGIAMNFLDVHINRAPIQGKISFIKHIKGLFISLKRKEAVIQNERVLIVIEGDSITIGIVQIASRLVRKIVAYVKQGNNVNIGQRIGMIRFGSQVDLLIPEVDNLKVIVKTGTKVKAGTSIIASLQSS
jgi:phosphatidylserine decarboxylase